MARDSNIPLFLWITTAALAHIAWGGGAERVSNLIEQQLDIRRFALTVQAKVRGQSSAFEVALVDEPSKPSEEPGEAPDPSASPDRSAEETQPSRPVSEPAKRPDEPAKQPAPEPTPPEPPKAVALPEVAPPKIAPEKQPAEPEKALELPKSQGRIAVKQHVEPNQEDNPEARFIGNEANRTKEETQARITSTDQNDKEPTPGGNHAGPTADPGDADHDKIAQSEDRPGEQDRAPSASPEPERPRVAAAGAPPVAPTPPGTPSAAAEDAKRGAASGADSSKARSTAPASPSEQAQRAEAGREAAPDTVNAPGGSPGVAERQRARAASEARPAKRKRLPPPRGARAGDWLGLGAPGTTRGGVNLNLTPGAALAAVGKEKLRDELRRDGERRRSAHLGSWRSTGIERWRASIENYVPSVKPGNQTALNTARVPFANYLNEIHNRLHPVFADAFLASLDALPDSSPMNRPDMSTNLEIVVSQDDGRIVRMGVTKTSGVTAFDIGALESVQRASPFGTPPREIISPDGNVYLHWEFYRNPYYACSTYFAHPFLLKVAPETAPPGVTPPPARPYDPREPPSKDQRRGALERSRPRVALSERTR